MEVPELEDSPTIRTRPKVVVVGGGFGGVNVSSVLAKSDIELTIIDRTNHHPLQPLLYQVATGILPKGLIAPGGASRCAETNEHQGRAPRSRGSRPESPYRWGASAGQSTNNAAVRLGSCCWCDPCAFRARRLGGIRPGMKTLEDARHLRNHILGASEMAEPATDGAESNRWSPDSIELDPATRPCGCLTRGSAGGAPAG
ncbi:MAG: FAD-dependent oxidoreductase [Mycolicibacterium sp.]|nr:FAD-dependent oxidoreductase [Mycolicibacterium sp.]